MNVPWWTSFERISYPCVCMYVHVYVHVRECLRVRVCVYVCACVRVCVSQEELLGRVESDRAREALRQARAKEDADALAATKEYLENSEAMVAAYVCRDCPSAPRATLYS